MRLVKDGDYCRKLQIFLDFLDGRVYCVNMKVVINRCYGGFNLSQKATEYLAERGHKEAAEHMKRFAAESIGGRWWGFREILRADPLLIEVVEKLGKEANGECAKLEVEEIEFNVENFIREYDGMESLEVPYTRRY